MSWTKEGIKDAVNKVVAKAEKDTAFREHVLDDVHGAVKTITGKEIPQNFKINVVDGTGYHANIVLSEVKTSKGELSETDMEMVAGGIKMDDGRPPISTNPVIPGEPPKKIVLDDLKN